jgi:UDP-glucose 4-epimerase
VGWREASITSAVVIGSSGFLGRALMNALTEAGTDAIGLTREDPFSSGDGLPVSELRRADGIAFLAGSVTPAIAESDPTAVADELRLFDAFIDCLGYLDKTPLVVIPSSGGTVYGTEHEPPFAETSLTRPAGAYGTMKLEMEHRLISVPDHVARVVALRISNAYGPGQKLGRGQGVTGHWMAAAARGEPLRVFGDLTATRDYIYIDDVVRAMTMVLSAEAGALLPRVLNIGSGVPTTLRELVDEVSGVVGGADIVLEPGRGFDVHDVWLDIRLANETIGWKPRVQLTEGLLRTWNHVRPA